jgi:hypothetical protein
MRHHGNARVARTFELYTALKQREAFVVSMRRGLGRSGIAVADDALAREYRERLSWRIHVVESFLSGKNTDPLFRSTTRRCRTETS